MRDSLLNLRLTLALCAAASVAHAQEQPGKLELDRTSLTPGVDRLATTIQGAVTQAGGTLDRTQAHWVLAFSTGHYKADPLGAQAAREVATQFIARNAVKGDQVTARAWELDTWAFRAPAGLTLQIGTDTGTDKAAAAQLWPTTPAVGSLGGHDTEQAAVTLTKEFERAPDTILILLTNTAASVGAPGSKLLGTNAPQYQDTLRQWTRVEGTQDGATLNLPYVIKGPAGRIPGQMQAVVFLPKTFTAAALPGTTRTELLNVAQASPPKSGQSSSALPLLLGLVVLGGLGIAAWKLLGKGGGGARGGVRVGETTFALRELPAGRPFCVIAGPGYVSEDDLAVVPVQGLPAARVAELSRIGKDIRVRGTHDDLKLSSVGGRVAVGEQALVSLRPEQPDVVVEFSGEVRTPGSSVPKDITRSVLISYAQGEG